MDRPPVVVPDASVVRATQRTTPFAHSATNADSPSSGPKPAATATPLTAAWGSRTATGVGGSAHTAASWP
jgi:hypothetical protein